MSRSPGDDLDLARQGDKQAISRLLSRHEPLLTRVAVENLGADLRARIRVSDVLQSTYLEAIEGIRKFRGVDSDDFRAWLVRILENNIRDKGKFFSAKRRAGDEPIDQEQLSVIGALRMMRRSPSSEAVVAEDFVLFTRALDNLSESYRRVIELRLIHGLSGEETAAELGRTPRAIRSMLSRARATLVLEYDRLRAETRRS